MTFLAAGLQRATARANAKALSIDTKGRHIFLCVPSKPKCCSKDVSEQTWEWLKKRLKVRQACCPRLPLCATFFVGRASVLK